MPPDDQPVAPPRSPSVVVLSIAVVAAVALLVAVAATAFQLSRPARSTSVDHDRVSALNTGRAVALAFTTLDYRQLTQDFARVGNLATPEFKTSYLTQTNQAAELIVKAKAISKGNVIAIAVGTLGGNTATVLAAVDETVTNTQQPKGQAQYYRLDISLQKQKDGRWLASAVTLV